MAIENLTVHAYAYPEEGAERIRIAATAVGDDGYALLDLPVEIAERLRDGLVDALEGAADLARGLGPAEPSDVDLDPFIAECAHRIMGGARADDRFHYAPPLHVARVHYTDPDTGLTTWADVRDQAAVEVTHLAFRKAESLSPPLT